MKTNLIGFFFLLSIFVQIGCSEQIVADQEENQANAHLKFNFEFDFNEENFNGKPENHGQPNNNGGPDNQGRPKNQGRPEKVVTKSLDNPGKEATTIKSPTQKPNNPQKPNDHSTTISQDQYTKTYPHQVGPFCQKIVSYFAGTLQHKNSNKTYDVEFQLKMWINEKKQKIHIEADNWNERYSKSQDFKLDFSYGDLRDWCEIYDNDCTSSFANGKNSFALGLNTTSGEHFPLLHFNSFNNSFGLSNSIGKCTKHQLEDDENSSFNKLSSCVCCDDYKPAHVLGCPADIWNEKENLTCKSAIAYHNGVFHNYRNERKIDVEFQTRLLALDGVNKVVVTIDHWNEKKTSSENLRLATNNGIGWYYNKYLNSTNDLADYTNNGDYLTFALMQNERGGWVNQYDFMTFPSFYDSFNLRNAVGHCIKTQHQNPEDSFNTNTTLYEFCICCGKNYDPHPSLGCPKNPWAVEVVN